MAVVSIAETLIETVVLKLSDGTQWPIILNFKVLCEFEKFTGINALFNIKVLAEELSFTNAFALLYVCLREQGAKYSQEELAKLTDGKIALVIRGLRIALDRSLIQKEDAAALEALPGEAEGELKAAG